VYESFDFLQFFLSGVFFFFQCLKKPIAIGWLAGSSGQLFPEVGIVSATVAFLLLLLAL
jgi:hypothetical protein